LGEIFTAMVSISTIGELVERGFLVTPRVFAPSKPELRGVHIKRGDYDSDELAERCDQRKLIGDIVEHWQRLAAGRPTIGFAVNVKHSQHLTAAFVAAGVRAEHLDGTTPMDTREGILRRLADGETQVVFNVGVLTEGSDIPPVSAIISARPTKSLGLMIQCWGRGLRLFPGKDDCIILDHAGLSDEHGSLLHEPVVDLKHGIRKRQAGDPALRLTTCLRCYAVYPTGPRECPNCGYCEDRASQGGLPLETAPGELTERQVNDVRVQRAREVAACKTLFELQALGVRRGYKPGWAEHVWQYRQRR
jgi:superfamily II DNA or RNA helicase